MPGGFITLLNITVSTSLTYGGAISTNHKVGAILLFFGVLSLFCMLGCSSQKSSSAGGASTSLTSIKVSPPSPTIQKQGTEQFTATGAYSNNTTQNLTSQVTWTSSNTAVATINAAGLATSAGPGNTTIQASLTGISGSTVLSVTSATLQSIAVSPASPSIPKQGTQEFTATGTYSNNTTQNLTSQVTWTSSNTAVATINAAGLATGTGPGNTTIQASLTGISGSTVLSVALATLQSIAVSPANPSIASGATEPFTATGAYSDNSTHNITTAVTWSSSNTSVATISNTSPSNGLATSAGTGTTTIQASLNGVNGSTGLTVTGSTNTNLTGVLTQNNDNGRTGQDLNETQLTLANVNTTSFGKFLSLPVDGYIYAQPLYVSNLSIAAATHNVVYVATEADSVYAFDADGGSLLWRVSLIDIAHGATSGETTGNIEADLDPNCTDLIPQVGITSTPVIDASTGAMYVEAKSKKSDGTYMHRLHMINITTGAEISPGPAVIAATVPGTSDGGTTDTFNDIYQLNRPGLLLLNGQVYLGYGSHCDDVPYHGWLFAYDATALTQTSVFITTPDGQGQGAIWTPGAGIAADSSGNIYTAIGNGNFDATDLGDSVVKFALSGSTISLQDYFTPFDQGNDDAFDLDIGSGGVLLLPDQSGGHPHELLTGSKDGEVYLIDRDQMTVGNQHYCSGCTSDSEILQEFPGDQYGNQLFSAAAYWNGAIYMGVVNDSLMAFSLSNGQINPTPGSSTTQLFPFPGTTPSISANGSTNGIVWAIDSSQFAAPAPAVLHAYDATNLANELWNSSQAANNRDTAGNAVKFTVPTVANGKVYIGTQTELDVYGLF